MKHNEPTKNSQHTNYTTFNQREQLSKSKFLHHNSLIDPSFCIKIHKDNSKNHNEQLFIYLVWGELNLLQNLKTYAHTHTLSSHTLNTHTLKTHSECTLSHSLNTHAQWTHIRMQNNRHTNVYPHSMPPQYEQISTMTCRRTTCLHLANHTQAQLLSICA